MVSPFQTGTRPRAVLHLPHRDRPDLPRLLETLGFEAHLEPSLAAAQDGCRAEDRRIVVLERESWNRNEAEGTLAALGEGSAKAMPVLLVTPEVRRGCFPGLGAHVLVLSPWFSDRRVALSIGAAYLRRNMSDPSDASPVVDEKWLDILGRIVDPS